MSFPTPFIDFEVAELIEDLGITSVRHFTTNRGLLGSLAVGQLLSRAKLQDTILVDLIRMNNCYRRWDSSYFNYVNLSLQTINGWLYNISSGYWHNGEDLWWAVLDFDPMILAHSGVVFCTTNNGYSTCQRAEGADGLTALWAPEVESMQRSQSRWLDRRFRAPDQPTDPQAEALYPEGVSTVFLRAIYVNEPERADSAMGYLSVTGHPDVPVIVSSQAFS